jgi:hypothetical protein
MLYQLFNSKVQFENSDFHFNGTEDICPDLPAEEYLIPSFQYGIPNLHSQDKYISVNSYIKSELERNSIHSIEKDSIPDEVSFMIKQLQKELMSVKTKNILYF